MRNKAWFCESSEWFQWWRCSWWILWCLAAWLCLASNSIEWLIPPDAGKNITRCFRCKYPEYAWIWIPVPPKKWPNTIYQVLSIGGKPINKAPFALDYIIFVLIVPQTIWTKGHTKFTRPEKIKMLGKIT